MKRLAMIISVVVVVSPLAFGDVLYVDVNNSGPEDGDSWGTAYSTIQEGIDAAGYYDQVWVAQGTYEESISLKGNTSVYAGFEGWESDLSERDIDAHPAVIDASTVDGGGPADHVVVMGGMSDARLDGFIITGGVADGESPDDQGGGIFCNGPNSSNIIANCTISGNSAAGGGGVYLLSASVRFINCTISGNSATWGGAVQCVNASPGFTNCTVSGNQATSVGGGFFCADFSDVTLTNCTVSGNEAPTAGGVYCQSWSQPIIRNTLFTENTNYAIWEDDAGAYPTVTYCLFHANPDGDYYDDGTTAYTGAANIDAAVAEVSNSVDGDPLFQAGASGTWTAPPSYDAGTNRTTLTDSSASFVAGALVGRLINPNTGQRFQALVTANANTTIEIAGGVTGFVIEDDSYVIADYHLTSDSAAVDAGPGSGMPMDDFDGESRPFGALYDIGVDEYVDTDGDSLSDWFEIGYDGDPSNYDPYDPTTNPAGTDLDKDELDTDEDGYDDDVELEWGAIPVDPESYPVWHVDMEAAGVGTGMTWEDAFTTIQAAIAAATGGGQEVWVAGGTYEESVTLANDVTLYGGFEKTEVYRADRDINGNPTIIDASEADSGSPADHVVVLSSTWNTLVDGFTITGGVADGFGEDGNGGGIYCINAGITNTIANCTVTGNSAGSGGGVYCRYQGVSFIDCVVAGNSATQGGGVYCDSSPNATFTTCTITDNDASSNGGGVHCYSNSSPVFTDCTISGNTSQGGYGGAIYCHQSDPSLADCTVTGNSAQHGGGVSCEYSNVTLTNCTIAGNYAAFFGYGGGIYCQSYSSPTLTSCTISGNLAGSGGGAYFYGGAPNLTNCILSGNSASSGGGGAYCVATSMSTLTNCTISSNTDSSGNSGGVHCYGGASLTFTNTVFADNTGYAIWEQNDVSDATVTYCLFHNNSVGDFYDEGTTGYTGAAEINVNVAEASDNVDGDPLFQMGTAGMWIAVPVYNADTNRTTLTDSAASFIPNTLAGVLINADTSQRFQAFVTANTAATIEVVGDVSNFADNGDTYEIIDYHLLSGSDAIDMGTDTGAPGNDFDGESRPFHTGHDIGVDEFVDSDGDTLSDWFEMGYDGDPRSYDPYDPTSNPTGTDLDYDEPDTDEDGSTDRDEIHRGTDPLDATDYPIPEVWYVDREATGAGDGTSWPDAFTTIQAAIDECIPDDEVWVAEGTYGESIILVSGMGLYGGFDGTETERAERDIENNVTTIDASTADGGGPADHVVVMDSTTNTLIDDFTITGGHADGSVPHFWGGGIYCNAADNTNTIANCTISENEANGGGGVFCGENSSPTLTNCVITGNSGGGVACYYQSDATLSGCYITGNLAPMGAGINCIESSPTVTDCTISDNRGTISGGGVSCRDPSVPVFTNCTITGNSAIWGGGVRCSSASPSFSACRISDNVATSGGGGIYCDEDSVPTVDECMITDNTTYEGRGGGVYATKSNVSLQNSTIMGNWASSEGGGIFCDFDIFKSTLTCSNCWIVGNESESWGGGIFCESGVVAHCTIAGNTGVYGGGVLCISSDASFTNCTISGNSAVVGGGVWSIYPSTPGPAFVNCNIISNEGGAVLCTDSSPILANTLFADNTQFAVREADVNADPVTRNCLFHDNPDGDYYDEGVTTLYTGADSINTNIPEASDNVDGDPVFQMGPSGTWTDASIYDEGTNSSTLTDSTAAFVPDALAGMLIGVSSSDRRHYLIVGNTETTIEVAGEVAGIVADVDEYQVMDYHVMWGSGAIDAGTPTDAPSDDFDGETRPFNTDYDIGVDEFVDIDGDTLSDYLEPSWELNPWMNDTDGDGLSDGEEAAYDGDPTDYDPFDPVTNPDGTDLDALDPDTDGDGSRDYAEVARGANPMDDGDQPEPGRWYVNQNAITPGHGTSWASGFTSIQEALDFSVRGDEIWVAAGIYEEGITLTSGVSLYGGFDTADSELSERDVDGNLTSIDLSAFGGANGFVAHVVIMEGTTNTRLDGFTITGGGGDGSLVVGLSGGGIYCVDADNTNTIANCTIMDNVSDHGGGVYCETSSPAFVQCTVTGNGARNGGGIYCSDVDNTGTIANCTISGNLAAESGGGIFCEDNSSPAFSNCAISDNETDGSGGGVYCDSSSPTFTDCSISGNASSKSSGGGISCHNNSDAALTNCTISGNQAHGSGGAVHCIQASPTFTGCAINGNESTSGSGGGVSAGFSSPNFINCNIDDNVAQFDGGGVFFDSSLMPGYCDMFDDDVCTATFLPTLLDCTISGNTAEEQAGGAVSCVSSSLSMSNCTVSGNTALQTGGGISCVDVDSTGAIVNCTITDNSASYGGGVSCRQSSSIPLTDCTIHGNWADYGGGVGCHESSPTFTDCTISGNSASYGGGIRCDMSALTVVSSMICGNSGNNSGGGIMWSDSDASTITSCTISGNRASQDGGGILCEASSPSLVNSIMSGNRASNGAGIHCSQSSPAVVNCTISDNEALINGGGIGCVSSSSPIVTNTIFDGNTNYAIHEGDVESDPVVTYCLFHHNPDGDYRDENSESYYGAANINANVSEASNNKDGVTDFQHGVGGTWTAEAVHDEDAGHTTLTDSAASFEPGALAGRLIAPDTAMLLQALITANTETTVVVAGDHTKSVDEGDAYQIVNHHITWNSAARDAGTSSGAPADDFEGDPRPFNALYDIGVDEYVDTAPPEAVCRDIAVELDDGGTVTITGDEVDGGSTDNCAISSVTVVPDTFTCADLGENEVTLTVTDIGGNTDTCEATVTVEDNTLPTVLCRNTTVEINAQGIATITADDVDGGSTDNCEISSRTVTQDTFSCIALGDNVILLMVTDTSGNTDTCEATVTVEDNTAPVVVCRDITIELDINGTATITVDDIDNGSSDNCGIESISVVPDSFTTDDLGENTVTLTVTDTSGNTATCQATVTVEENSPPTAVCRDIIVELDATGTATITGEDVDGGSTDNVGISSRTVMPNTFTLADLGENAVTLTVADTNGNTDTCQTTVTVKEHSPPTAVCRDITVELDATGTATITGADVDGGSTDNAGIRSLTVDTNTFTCTDLGDNIVTLTVTDLGGNVGTCQATVTVEDNVPPTAVCRDITVELDQTDTATIAGTDVDGGSTDNCGISSLTVSPNTFTLADLGANVVTFTVTDVAGNTATCQATVTVEENSPPIAVCRDITIELGVAGTVTITGADVDGGSSDNAGISALTVDPNTFTQADLGENRVTLTVIDMSGNTATCQATVTVEESSPPVAVCRDFTVEIGPAGTATIMAEDVDGGSTDNAGISSLTVEPNTFTQADLGENTVTLTVTDTGGATATCQATVTVEESNPPTAVCRDITVELDAAGTATITAEDVDGGSADTRGISTRTVDPNTFTCADLGDNTVTLTVADTAGNIATCQATVTVTDPLHVCMPGDVNSDGAVDAIDVQFVINEALGLTVGYDCDINSDSSVDAIDIQLVINAVLGIDISGTL